MRVVSWGPLYRFLSLHEHLIIFLPGPYARNRANCKHLLDQFLMSMCWVVSAKLGGEHGMMMPSHYEWCDRWGDCLYVRKRWLPWCKLYRKIDYCIEFWIEKAIPPLYRWSRAMLWLGVLNLLQALSLVMRQWRYCVDSWTLWPLVILFFNRVIAGYSCVLLWEFVFLE